MQRKFCLFPPPPTDRHPCFLTRACPLQLSLVPKKFKSFTHFSLNFDYFLAQNCIRKLYFMLKTPNKICSNFAVRGHFWPQWTIFQSPPPICHLTPSLMRVLPSSDSVPDASPPLIWLRPKRRLKITPESKCPHQKFCKKNLNFNS